jgi:alpha/beta superfamily hydrolase
MSVSAPQFATPDRFQSALGARTQVRPVVFDGHLGWLHLPAGPSRREAGVLLVTPPGRDGRWVYRPLRDLAERLARDGFPTLRFDLKGVGDSLELTDDDDAWPVWLDGVAAAAGFLKTNTDIGRLVLGGVRLGASLAASAPVERDGLILLAPVVSGPQWLCDLTLDGEMHAVGGLEADGFYLSPATAATLARLDLTDLSAAPRRALVAGHDTGSTIAAGRLAQLGCDVTDSDFPSYEALFSRVAGWLDRSFPARVPQEVIALRLAAEPVALRPPGAIEHPVRFGYGLNGVLCRPDGAASDGRAVIFGNTGGEPRAGIGRFAVLAARALAHRGVASLRFDFGGLGDSEGTDSDPASRLDDFDSATTLLAVEGFPEVSLVGVGSGAFHAMRALIADPRIGGAFVVNARLVRRPGEDSAEAIEPGPAGLLRALYRRLAAGMPGEEGRALREGLAEVAERGGRAHLLTAPGDLSMGELEACFGGRARKLTAMPGMSFHIAPGLDHDLSHRDSREIALKELLTFVGAD